MHSSRPWKQGGGSLSQSGESDLVLQHLNRICHPDVYLIEPRLQSFLELHEESSAGIRIGCVDEHTNQLVAEDFRFVRPDTANRMALAGDGAEVTAQFKHGICDEFRWGFRRRR